MKEEDIRKEFLDKMQLNITTTNLRNGKTWWDEYINFLEKEISKLRLDAVSGAVCSHDWFGIDQCHSKCRKCGRIERDD